jgi:hypothetical protein
MGIDPGVSLMPSGVRLTYPAKDEIGKRYGCLLVLERKPWAGEVRRRARWLCRCDCGREKAILGDHLRSGATVSCGCHRKPFVYVPGKGRPAKNELGKRYGWLTVIELQPRGGGPHSRWICRCDCGTETVVPSKDLRSGHSRSCGCVLEAVRVGRRRWVKCDEVFAALEPVT